MAASVTPLWSSRTPACWRHRLSLARADKGHPGVLGARGQGASRSWDSVTVTAHWQCPRVTWCVAATFSPCPLASEWTPRRLRSPHDMGQVGTSTDAPFSLAVAHEADPARTPVRRTKAPSCTLYPRTL